jgi:hypothetical protein
LRARESAVFGLRFFNVILDFGFVTGRKTKSGLQYYYYFAAFDLNFGPCLPPSKIPAKTHFFDFGTPVYVAYRGPRRTGANAMQAPPGASPCVKTRLAATRLGPLKMLVEKKKSPNFSKISIYICPFY